MEMLVHLNLSVVEVVLDLPEVQTLAIHLMEVKGDHFLVSLHQLLHLLFQHQSDLLGHKQ